MHQGRLSGRECGLPFCFSVLQILFRYGKKTTYRIRYVCFPRALPFVLLLNTLPHPFLHPYLVPPPPKTYNKRATQPGGVVAGVVATPNSVPKLLPFRDTVGANFFEWRNGLGLIAALRPYYSFYVFI